MSPWSISDGPSTCCARLRSLTRGDNQRMRHRPPKAVDWLAVMWDLIQRDQSLLQVSRRIGIPHSTLRIYLDGSHPPHWRGEIIIEAWCLAVGKDRGDLPMQDVQTMPRVVIPRAQFTASAQALKDLAGVWR